MPIRDTLAPHNGHSTLVGGIIYYFCHKLLKYTSITLWTFRRYNKINNILFREDLAACFPDTSSDLDGLIDQFTSSITDIINKHAPLTTRKIPIRQSFPWYSIDIKLAKQERRKAERRWNHTGLTIHRDIFKYHRRKVKELIAKAKAKYYQDAIIEWSDSKSLFRVMDHLLKHRLKISQTDLQIISRIKLLTSVQWYLRNKNKMIMIMNHLVWIHQTWSALILSVL